MASLHAWRNGALPDDREQLYDESLDLLLDLWERPKVVLNVEGKPVLQSESASVWFNCPRSDIRQALEKLAYEVHGSMAGVTGVADIDEDKLVGAIRRAADDKDLPHERVLEYIRDRAGLLNNRGEGVYSFPHRTFQEYLAARYLTRVGFPNVLVKLVKEDVERWREVLLLAGARSATVPSATWSLVERLYPNSWQEENIAGITDSDWWAVQLAGQLLVETRIHTSLDPDADGPDIAKLDHVRTWLAALVEGEHLPPVDRAAAGQALGRLGDERTGRGGDRWRAGHRLVGRDRAGAVCDGG